MKFIPFHSFLLLLLIVNACKPNADRITIIDVKDYGQFFEPNKKSIFNFGNTISIAFNGNARLFIEIEIALTTEGVFDDKGEKIGEKVIRQDSSYVYNVVQNGERYGLTYKQDFNRDSGVIFNVDTFFVGVGWDKKNMALLNMDLGAPSTVIKEKNIVLQKFLFAKERPSDPDSIYRYYDRNFKNVQFSFSKSLDSLSGSKLTKTLIIYKPVSKVQGSQIDNIPRRVLETSMTRNTTYEIDHVREIFKKFSKDKNAHKLK